MAFKVNYNKSYGYDGTVYTQTITISEVMFNALNDMIEHEITNDYPRVDEYKWGDKLRAKLYLTHLHLAINNLSYLKLTQLRFIYLFFKSLDKNDRIKLDRNTIIKVVKEGRVSNE